LYLDKRRSPHTWHISAFAPVAAILAFASIQVSALVFFSFLFSCFVPFVPSTPKAKDPRQKKRRKKKENPPLKSPPLKEERGKERKRKKENRSHRPQWLFVFFFLRMGILPPSRIRLSLVAACSDST
jgi:hypothetical protein